MKLLAKELIARHQEKRPVATGFVTYISDTEPVLMHCYGWEDYSDGYDDYAVTISRDNGRTWADPEERWKSIPVPEGRIRYAEPAAFFDPDAEKLLVLADRFLYPDDGLDVDASYTLTMDVYDPATRVWSDRREIPFPGQRSAAVSFSFPIKTSRGRILFPGMRQVVDAGGKTIHYRGCWAPVDEMVTIIGEYNSRGDVDWWMGQPLNIPQEVSSRGVDENALAELADGRIAAICRGDNSMFPEKPGRKWVSFSENDGETWSVPVPLAWASGEALESGGSGSALFRSVKNGRLYWIGNICLGGERPNGNMPRTRLMVIEMQEEPFALKPGTLFVIDEKGTNDSPDLQLSNFRFYQDRETGDLVLFMVRYCEHSSKEWWRSDYYRYRVEMP